jgi:hypothetical protein
MDPPDLEPNDVAADGGDSFETTTRNVALEHAGEIAGMGWLGEIVARLEDDPDECWPALESLAAVDGEVRVRIVAALAEYRERPGVRILLRLLGSARDPLLQAAARLALSDEEVAPDGGGGGGGIEGHPGAPAPIGRTATWPAAWIGRSEAGLAVDPGRSAGRIVRSLVTALDGGGRGTIVVSVADGARRRTAAFRCDVRHGILDVVGEVEPEHGSVGGLVDEWIGQADGDYALDVPELAVGLLGGCLTLSGPAIPARFRAWLDAMIAPGALAAGFPAIIPGPELATIPDEEMPARARSVLDACPSWLDRSTLTFELAREITLREGRSVPNPVRDAGAYRYLFEHMLSRHLELYARMLLWMAWVWRASGRSELARSAFALAAQISDEQYAVPSHPFTVALATRSLQAAQSALLTGGDPVAGVRSPDA